MNQGVLYIFIQKKVAVVGFGMQISANHVSDVTPDIQIKSREICTWKVVPATPLLFGLSVPPPRTLSTATPSLVQNTSRRGFPLVFPAPPPSESLVSLPTAPLQCPLPLPLHRAPAPALHPAPASLRLRQCPRPARCVNAPFPCAMPQPLRRGPRSVQCVSAPAPVLPPLGRH
jgi:hypothetical protein